MKTSPRTYSYFTVLVLLVTASILTSCASRPTKEWGDAVQSKEDFALLLMRKYPYAQIASKCVPENRWDDRVQQPVVFFASTWHGHLFEKEALPDERIDWDAVVLDGRVQAYRIVVHRPNGFWLVAVGFNPALRYLPDGSVYLEQPKGMGRRYL